MLEWLCISEEYIQTTSISDTQAGTKIDAKLATYIVFL